MSADICKSAVSATAGRIERDIPLLLCARARETYIPMNDGFNSGNMCIDDNNRFLSRSLSRFVSKSVKSRPYLSRGIRTRRRYYAETFNKVDIVKDVSSASCVCAKQSGESISMRTRTR